MSNKYNVTSVTDLEVCKTMFGDNDRSYSNDSKHPSKENNETKAEHCYKAKEEQARNKEHCHIYLDHVDDSYTANVAYSNNIVAANIAMSVDEATFRKLMNGM